MQLVQLSFRLFLHSTPAVARMRWRKQGIYLTDIGQHTRQQAQKCEVAL